MPGVIGGPRPYIYEGMQSLGQGLAGGMRARTMRQWDLSDEARRRQQALEDEQRRNAREEMHFAAGQALEDARLGTYRYDPAHAENPFLRGQAQRPPDQRQPLGDVRLSAPQALSVPSPGLAPPSLPRFELNAPTPPTFARPGGSPSEAFPAGSTDMPGLLARPIVPPLPLDMTPPDRPMSAPPPIMPVPMSPLERRSGEYGRRQGLAEFATAAELQSKTRDIPYPEMRPGPDGTQLIDPAEVQAAQSYQQAGPIAARFGQDPAALEPFNEFAAAPPGPDPYKMGMLDLGRGKLKEQERHNQALEAAARARNKALQDRVDILAGDQGQDLRIEVMKMAQRDNQEYEDALMNGMKLTKPEFSALTPQQIGEFEASPAGRQIRSRFTVLDRTSGESYFRGGAQAADYWHDVFTKGLPGIPGSDDDKRRTRTRGVGDKGIEAAERAAERELDERTLADARRRYNATGNVDERTVILESLTLDYVNAGFAEAEAEKRAKAAVAGGGAR